MYVLIWICIFCNFAAFIDSCYDSLILEIINLKIFTILVARQQPSNNILRRKMYVIVYILGIVFLRDLFNSREPQSVRG